MTDGSEKSARAGWIIWFVILVLSAYVVPYKFIGNIASPYASFLYWTLFALAAVISIIAMMGRWRDKE